MAGLRHKSLIGVRGKRGGPVGLVMVLAALGMTACGSPAPTGPPPASLAATPPPVASPLAQQLGTAPEGSVVPLRGDAGAVGEARIGNVYVAASGRTCRRVILRVSAESMQMAVCEAAGQWAFTSPLQHSDTADLILSGQVGVS